MQGDRAHGIAIAETLADKELKNVEIDISDCPDLLPPAAAAAAVRGEGMVTSFRNAARLRMKESDRLSAVTSVINALGGCAVEERDGITICGLDSLNGGVENDMRPRQPERRRRDILLRRPPHRDDGGCGGDSLQQAYRA